MNLGKGTHVYEIAEGWGNLPEGVEYGYTHGVVVDSQDNVYIHSTSKDAVIKFDREGNYLGSWGEEFKDSAHGMYLSKEGEKEYLYLTDPGRHMMVKTTLDGEVIFRLGVPPLPEVYIKDDLYAPTDAAVAPNGDIYVVDGYGQSWIHQYNKEGQYIRSWGGKGSEPGQLNCPHGVWVDTRGEEPLLYIADRENRRIQIFTLDGVHVRFVTEEIDYPCCFYQYQDELYIPDLFSAVTILDKNDKLIVHLGEDKPAREREGWPNVPKETLKPDKFSSPHGLCVDSHGDIYISEWISYGRVTKLIRQR